jgi:glutamate formiminotransferase/formiminotetrahydrofolate cyclodeaminase
MQELGGKASALAARLSSLVSEDSEAYARVSEAYKLPKNAPAQQAARDQAVQRALARAAEVPLETARACAHVAALAATCAEKGNTNAASDAGVAALLAEAACRGAAYNVRINVAAMADRSGGAPMVQEVERLVKETSAAAARATAAVERLIG